MDTVIKGKVIKTIITSMAKVLTLATILTFINMAI